MKAPPPTAIASLSSWGHSRSAGAQSDPDEVSGTQAVVPAVTQAERDASQQFINANCHGLARCQAGTGCAQLLQRGVRANECVGHRFRVRAYYAERNVPDPGDHQQAIVWDDDVAQGCLARYRAECLA